MKTGLHKKNSDRGRKGKQQSWNSIEVGLSSGRKGKQQSWNSIQVDLSSGRKRKTTVVEQYRGRPVIWKKRKTTVVEQYRGRPVIWKKRKTTVVEQYPGRPVIWQKKENNSRGTVSRSACHLADRGKQQSWNSIEVGLSSGRKRKTTVVEQYRGRPVIWQKKENNSRGTVSRSACHLADRGKQQSWNSIEVGLSSGRYRKTTVVEQYRGRPVIWQT